MQLVNLNADTDRLGGASSSTEIGSKPSVNTSEESKASGAAVNHPQSTATDSPPGFPLQAQAAATSSPQDASAPVVAVGSPPSEQEPADVPSRKMLVGAHSMFGGAASPELVARLRQSVRAQPNEVASRPSEPAASGHDAVGVETVPSAPALPLPQGWVALTDEASGQVFYGNPSTGQTQWHMPTSAAVQGEGCEATAVVAVAAAEAEAAAKKKMVEDAAAAAAAVAAAEVAEAAAKKNAEDAAAAAAAAAAAVTAAVSAHAETNLPAGWVAQTDSASGRVFYANALTGHTQWSPPAVPNALHSTERTPEHTPSPKAQLEVQPIEARLPGGWEERVDPTTARPFYVHRVTGASQWERPKDPPVQSSEAPAGADAMLPPGWQERSDQSGRIFYANLESGATQWERPSVASPRPSSVNSNASC